MGEQLSVERVRFGCELKNFPVLKEWSVLTSSCSFQSSLNHAKLLLPPSLQTKTSNFLEIFFERSLEKEGFDGLREIYL